MSLQVVLNVKLDDEKLFKFFVDRRDIFPWHSKMIYRGVVILFSVFFYFNFISIEQNSTLTVNPLIIQIYKGDVSFDNW